MYVSTSNIDKSKLCNALKAIILVCKRLSEFEHKHEI